MGFIRGAVKVVFWLLAFVGIAFIGLVVAGFLFTEALTGPRKKVPDQAVLVVDLTQGLAHQRLDIPFGPTGRPTVEDVVLGLEAAASDSRVKGVLLRLGRGPLDMSQAQEIRDAVAHFQESSRPVHAFAETFGEAGDGTLHYYTAASADQIFLQPSGDVRLMGFLLEQPFLRGALDWLGIEPQVVARKEYKSTPDIFTETAMTVPVRQNLQQLADSWLTQVVEGIAADRQVDTATARRWIDESPWDAAQAKQAGMVDELAYWDQAEAVTLGVLGEDAAIGIADYAAQIPDPGDNAPRIAIVRGTGAVILGKGDVDPFGGEGTLGSETIANAISSAVEDRVRAIILRVDSPGGSYVAADAIWREVTHAKEMNIPVVVSFGAIAASGGYFVAAPASKIVAEPGTITGSIGVFAGKPVLTDMWNKLSIRFDGVQAGAAAETDSANHGYSPEAWGRLQTRLDAIYADFVAKVAAGRGLKPEQAEAAAKGQIWSGADAKARGLVDELGGLAMAIRVAKQESKIAQESAVRLVTYPPARKQWETFLSSFMSDGVSAPSLQAPGDAAKLLQDLRPLIEQPDAVFLWAPPIAVNGRLR